MYASAYGLSELPFELTTDPKFLFLTTRQREALSILEYGLASAKPLTVLIGEAGTGKTMLLHAALESERCRAVEAIYLNNPILRPDDLFRLLAARLDLGADAGESKAIFLARFEDLLRRRHSMGTTTALVIDEAQALPPELLEEIRMLANIETPEVRLLPLLLAGQPAFAERLEDPGLRQVRQRVALRCQLEPFRSRDTAAYIASRITKVGGEPARMFTREAVALIHRYSGGIPRMINVICDNALVTGMALGARRVDQGMVLEACRDLCIQAPDESPAPPPAVPAASVEAVPARHTNDAAEDAAGEPPASGTFRFGRLAAAARAKK